jgi:hypothetical protein
VVERPQGGDGEVELGTALGEREIGVPLGAQLCAHAPRLGKRPLDLLRVFLTPAICTINDK